MTLLNSVDLTPNGKIVPRAEIGEEGYAENIEYVLEVVTAEDNSRIYINYYGEDNTYLNDRQIMAAIKLATQ